jgi:predicted dehydrogenase
MFRYNAGFQFILDWAKSGRLGEIIPSGGEFLPVFPTNRCGDAGIRGENATACAEAGVKIIYPTKPLSNTLAEGDAMIRKCRESGSLLAVSCHQNWSPWFQACRKSIQNGDIGEITAIINQKSLIDHNAALMRMFAKAPPKWVIGDVNTNGPSGMFGFENDVRGFFTPGGWQNLQIIGTDGWIDVRDEYREFELWRRFPDGFPPEMVKGFQTFGLRTREDPPARVLFPNPRVPMSSQLASIDALVSDYENGTTPECPGEWGVEAMEVLIGVYESAHQGGRKLEMPLADRSLSVDLSRYR